MNAGGSPVPSPADRPGSFSALDWVGVGLAAAMGLGLLVAHVAVTPAFGSMYAEMEAALPMVTRLAISRWFTPLVALLPSVLVAAALVGGGPLALRRGLVVAGFVCGLAAVAVYCLALYAPLRPLPVPVNGLRGQVDDTAVT